MSHGTCASCDKRGAAGACPVLVRSRLWTQCRVASRVAVTSQCGLVLFVGGAMREFGVLSQERVWSTQDECRVYESTYQETATINLNWFLRPLP